MSLFGFGTPAELQTPMGVVVKEATNNLRLNPDWSKNMDICDAITRQKGSADQVAKAIRRRLQESDQQTIFLSLTLLEACVKNCGDYFVSSFDRPLMDEVVNITKRTKGHKNADEALRLIQQWGRMFEKERTYPMFFETYMSLKSRGAVFPKEEPLAEVAPAQKKRNESISKPSATQPAPAAPVSVEQEPPKPNVDEFEKLQGDLAAVVEKVKLCREMLLVSPGIQSDEALSDVIGFLEACRDRMVDLIEAGTQGLLGESLFEEVLKVNDMVYRTLEAEKNGLKLEVDDGVSGKPEGKSAGDSQLVDLNPQEPAKKPVTINEDLFGLMEAPATSTNPPPAPITSDPFGSVFGGSSQVPAANPTPSKVPPPPAGSSQPLQQANVHTPDEFDLLFNSTPSKLPPPPAQTTTNTTSTNQQPNTATDDFDSFFASLK